MCPSAVASTAAFGDVNHDGWADLVVTSYLSGIAEVEMTQLEHELPGGLGVLHRRRQGRQRLAFAPR